MTRYTRIVFKNPVPAGRLERQALSAADDRVSIRREGDVVVLQFHDGRLVEAPWSSVRYGVVDQSALAALGAPEGAPARPSPRRLGP